MRVFRVDKGQPTNAAPKIQKTTEKIKKEVLFTKSPRANGLNGNSMSTKFTNYPLDLPTTPAAAFSVGRKSKSSLIAKISKKFTWFKVRTKNEKILLLVTLILLLICIILFILTIVFGVRSPSFDDSKVCRSNACIASAAMLLQNMDTSADPCTDFYQFACGNFLLNHPIPDSDQSTDWFLEKKTSVKREIRDALQFKKSSPFEPLPVRQLRGFFSDCLDTDMMEQKGVQPLRNLLTAMEISRQPSILDSGASAVPNMRFQWHKAAAAAKKLAGIDLLIGVSIYPDPLNNSRNLLGIVPPNWQSPFQGGWKKPNQWHPERYMKRINLVHSRSKRALNPQQQQAQQREVMLRQQYMKNVIEKLMAIGIGKGPEYGQYSRQKRQSEVEVLLEEQQVEDFVPVDFAVKQIFQLEGQLHSAANGTGGDQDYKMLTIEGLQTLSDQFTSPESRNQMNWELYLNTIFDGTNVSLNQIDIIQVYVPYLQNLAAILSSTPPTTVEGLMWWLVVDASVPHTIRQMRQIRQSYVEDVTYGQTAPSRTMFCAGLVNKMMGIAVSYIFATPSFVQGAREKIGSMMEDIRSAFVDKVQTLEWMDEETRKATLLKAKDMRVNIAFPDFVLTQGGIEDYYAGLEFEEGQFFNNMVAIVRLYTRNMLRNLPNVNRQHEIWASDPTDVNAYHTFGKNSITVPAAILQFPFFNLGMDVLDYGAIGSILGHELTHGFDNTGRLYDEMGNYRPWWTNTTLVEYEKRTSCFVQQYDKFRIPELHANVNGFLTLGENIADNGGIRSSMKAYQKLRARSGPDFKELLPGLEFFSPEKLLYLAFSNLWCEQASFLAMKWSLNEAHAPNRARIWGTLGNSRLFAETWNCPLHSPMNPRDKCELW